jgi:hypothetical protein
VALKGASDVIRQRVFANMSKRAVDLMKEEMEMAGRGPPARSGKGAAGDCRHRTQVEEEGSSPRARARANRMSTEVDRRSLPRAHAIPVAGHRFECGQSVRPLITSERDAFPRHEGTRESGAALGSSPRACRRAQREGYDRDLPKASSPAIQAARRQIDAHLSGSRRRSIQLATLRSRLCANPRRDIVRLAIAIAERISAGGPRNRQALITMRARAARNSAIIPSSTVSVECATYLRPSARAAARPR